MPAPNQRHITIHRNEKELNELRSSGYKYSFSIHAYDRAAMRELSGNGFKLYTFLKNNQDGYRFFLNETAVYNATGLQKKAYLAAFRELVEHRFLIPQPNSRTGFDFFLIGESTTISAAAPDEPEVNF